MKLPISIVSYSLFMQQMSKCEITSSFLFDEKSCHHTIYVQHYLPLSLSVLPTLPTCFKLMALHVRAEVRQNIKIGVFK